MKLSLILLSLFVGVCLGSSTISKAAVGYDLRNADPAASPTTTDTPAQCVAQCIDSGATCKGVNFCYTGSTCTFLGKDYADAGVNLTCNTDCIHYTINEANMPGYNAKSPQMACLIHNGGSACTKPYQTCTVSCTSDRWSPNCESTTYTSCLDAYNNGERRDGVYLLSPDSGTPFEAYCEMTTDPVSNEPGGYTVVYRRMDATYPTLQDYTWTQMVAGFGDLNGEHFIGLAKMNRISAVTNELYISLWPFEGDNKAAAYARYSGFNLNSAGSYYSLSVPTFLGGNAGESLQWQASFNRFATIDNDATTPNPKCTVRFTAPGWFNACHGTNPFGRYLYGPHTVYAQGMEYSSYAGHHYSYQRTEWRVK